MCPVWTTTLIPEKQGPLMRNISGELVRDKETLITFEEDTDTSHSRRWFIMKAGKRSVWNQIIDQMTLHCLLKPLRVTLSLLALFLHQNYHGSIILCVFFPPSFFITFHLCRCIATWKQPVVDGQSSSAGKTAVWTSKEHGKSTRWWDNMNAHRHSSRIQKLIHIH